MKTKRCVLFAVIFVLLQARTGIAQQAMTYLDNTSQSISSAGAFNDTPYLAAQFLTGTNVDGYVINCLQFLFADASGSPDFPYLKCYLLSDNYNRPFVQLDSFIPNDNPTTAGLHTFVRQQPLFSPATLDANTDYWLLFSSYGGSSLGYYRYSLTDSSNSVAGDGWSITGNVWPGQAGIPMFTINATPIPEPKQLSLCGVGLFVSITFCLRRMALR